MRKSHAAAPDKRAYATDKKKAIDASRRQMRRGRYESNDIMPPAPSSFEKGRPPPISTLLICLGDGKRSGIC